MTSTRAPISAALSTPITTGATPFHWRVRVYWEDTDAGGIVFYANYLKFFERARTEWLRATGIEQEVLRESEGALFVVSETHVRYLRPARLDDLIDLSVTLRDAGQASLTFVQQACRSGEILAEGEIRVACVNAESLRPRRFPHSLMKILS